MRTIRLLALTALFTSAVAVYASNLAIGVRHHSTLLPKGGQKHLAYGIFTDDTLVVDVRLDVFRIAQLPSSQASYEELLHLTPSTWLDRVHFRLTRQTDGREIALPKPLVRKNDVRDRGPNAVAEADRDASVDCLTFQATLDLGTLDPGEYTLAGSIAGLTAEFSFVVRTGAEPEWRDIYLHDKAIHAKSYDEYRRITLERLRWDGERASTVLDLIDRALQYGTLAETLSYVARLRGIVDRRARMSGTNPTDIRLSRDYFTEFERALPEYFSRRREWTMVRDATTGNHVIRSRVDGSVIKEVGRGRITK